MELNERVKIKLVTRVVEIEEKEATYDICGLTEKELTYLYSIIAPMSKNEFISNIKKSNNFKYGIINDRDMNSAWEFVGRFCCKISSKFKFVLRW